MDRWTRTGEQKEVQTNIYGGWTTNEQINAQMDLRAVVQTGGWTTGINGRMRVNIYQKANAWLRGLVHVAKSVRRDGQDYPRGMDLEIGG